jgi:hypothetical protein
MGWAYSPDLTLLFLALLTTLVASGLLSVAQTVTSRR